jgi:hypothetical protein
MWQLAAIPALTIASCIAYVCLFVFPSRISLLATLVFSSVTLGVLLYIAWFFRDGLGPDAVTTTGVAAWRHFMFGAAFPLIAWSFIVVTGLVRYWWSTRQRPNNSFKPNPHQVH